MTACEYLSRMQDMEAELSYKLTSLKCLREKVPGGLITGTGRGGEAADRTGDAACRAQEMEREIGLLYARIDAARREIRAALQRLPNARMRSLLEMRYVTGFKWEEVAEALGISLRAAYRLHQRAMRMVAVYLPPD